VRVGNWIVVVIWYFGVISLSGVWTQEVWTSEASASTEVLTSQLNSAYLDRCFAALLKPSTARVGINPA
jgi:hypothetical protein